MGFHGKETVNNLIYPITLTLKIVNKEIVRQVLNLNPTSKEGLNTSLKITNNKIIYGVITIQR